tara:strand:- start:260 stop:451 length:192 start_codon:yes stop_codon:yes gene_type:complete
MFEKPENWDFGWCAVQVEETEWAITYNGCIVEKEFASHRDALDKAWVWEEEMTSQWRTHVQQA